MRRNIRHRPAGPVAPMPFGGLGFTASGVRQAAREMTPVVRRHCGGPAMVPAGCPHVAASGGYKLLVALGREIRGR